MEYFEGKWSYEITDGREGGVEMKYVAGKCAMMATRDAERKSVHY